MTTGATVRASDAERERVVQTLAEQAALGRLTLEELEERTEAAYAARTRLDLERLTHDLPDAGATGRGGHDPVVGDHEAAARAPAWIAVLLCCCGPCRRGKP